MGYSNSSTGLQAFRWTQDGGMVGRGHLPNGGYPRALGVSGDGSIVVGEARAANGYERASAGPPAAASPTSARSAGSPRNRPLMRSPATAM